MNKLIRSSALTWALGYVLLGLAALGAFALVLWYAWNVTIFADREEVLQDDAQRLTAVFDRDGIAGLNAYINARVGLQIVGERTLLLSPGCASASPACTRPAPATGSSWTLTRFPGHCPCCGPGSGSAKR